MGPEGRVEGRAEKASAGPLGTHSVSLPPDLDPSPVDHPAPSRTWEHRGIITRHGSGLQQECGGCRTCGLRGSELRWGCPHSPSTAVSAKIPIEPLSLLHATHHIQSFAGITSLLAMTQWRKASYYPISR